jgi:hypothetical protein
MVNQTGLVQLDLARCRLPVPAALMQTLARPPVVTGPERTACLGQVDAASVRPCLQGTNQMQVEQRPQPRTTAYLCQPDQLEWPVWERKDVLTEAQAD